MREKAVAWLEGGSEGKRERRRGGAGARKGAGAGKGMGSGRGVERREEDGRNRARERGWEGFEGGRKEGREGDELWKEQGIE